MDPRLLKGDQLFEHGVHTERVVHEVLAGGLFVTFHFKNIVRNKQLLTCGQSSSDAAGVLGACSGSWSP